MREDGRTLHVLEPVAEWRASDVADPESWTLRLRADDHDELAHALAVARNIKSPKTRLTDENMRRRNFRTLASRRPLREVRAEPLAVPKGQIDSRLKAYATSRPAPV